MLSCLNFEDTIVDRLAVDPPVNMADEFDLEALVHLEQTLAS
jgi:hypothetical protein